MEQSKESHKQIEMSGVLIDLGISELIRTLWYNGIDTIQCCEGGYELDKHFDIIDGFRFTFEKNGKIIEKAHIIFYKKDLESIKKFLPVDTEYVIGDNNSEKFSGWLGSYDGCWASFIHKKK